MVPRENNRGDNMALIFDGNDEAYQAWIAANPDGWVLNARRSLTTRYMVLHSVQCSSIRTYNDMAQPGGFTERAFVKICSPEIEDLRSWVRIHGRPDGSFSKECSHCVK